MNSCHLNKITYRTGDCVTCINYNHDKSAITESIEGTVKYGLFWIEPLACHSSWQVLGWYIESKDGEHHSIANYNKVIHVP